MRYLNFIFIQSECISNVEISVVILFEIIPSSKVYIILELALKAFVLRRRTFNQHQAEEQLHGITNQDDGELSEYNSVGCTN